MDQKPTYEKLELVIRQLEKQRTISEGTDVPLNIPESIYCLMLESISGVVIITDDLGKILYVSPNTINIFGLSQDEIYDLSTIQMLFNGSVCDALELKEKGEIQNIEREIRDAAGTKRFLLVNARSVNINGGTALYVMRDITKRWRIEKDLQEREQRFRQIIDHSPAVIYTKNLEGNYTMINRKFEQLSGYKKDQVIGKNDFDLFPESVAVNSTRNDKEVVKGKKPVEIEEFGPVSGKIHSFVSSKYPLIDEAGNVCGISGVSLDITDRKKVEKALISTEEKYRRLADNSPDMIYRMSLPDGKYEYVNPAAEAISGYPPEKWYANPLLIKDIIHPDWQGYFQIEWSKLLKGHLSPTYEYQIVHKDQSVRWINQRNVAVRNQAGDLVAIEGIVTDITGRKQAEEALRKKEKKYKTIIQTAIDGFWLTDLQGQILETNEAYCRMSGFSEEEVCSMNIADLDDIEIPSEVAAHIQKHVAQGGDRFETRHRHKDGNVFDVEASVRYLPDREGRLVAFLRDITARKRADEKIHKLNETLEQRVAERTVELENRSQQLQQLALELSDAEDRERRNIASILHDDFQQELAFIKMELDMIRQKDVDKNVGQRLGILTQLLDKNIEKSRNLSYEINPPALHRNGLLAPFEVLAQDMKIKHSLEVTVRTQPSADIDSPTLAQILYRATKELLFNVAKHAGVDSAILDVRSKNNLIHIRVEDFGNGFDYDMVRSRQGTGAGFGLYNIEDRIAFLGGSMKIQTAPGKGCCVVLTVPKDVLRKSTRSAVSAGDSLNQELMRVETVAPTQPFDDSGKIRILLADDHALMRQALANLLQGCEGLNIVGQAVNGREAVQLAAKLKPDVILMDVAMPELDGFEATAQIKRELPDIHIIGLSMHNDADTRQKMFNAGASAYLTKTDAVDTVTETILHLYHGTKCVKGAAIKEY